jgi:4-hydroxythreonine-4-phosphate dehydrogenase
VPRRLRLALTLGDPAGIGPEIALRALATPPAGVDFVLVGERAALAAARSLVPEFDCDRLVETTPAALAGESARGPVPPVALLDPVGERRALAFGRSGPADARAALAALDAAIALARAGAVDALVTAPVAKGSIARHALPGFVGHTDHLARACGLERYGRDYLMGFLAPDLQVALLTVHEPLARALAALSEASVRDALACLARTAGGKIALAALNPHAGEGGLLGGEEAAILAPAVAAARALGVDAHGPESADSLFARARRGEYDWVLALYHDQGLVAVKTVAFGRATNWTLGLPFVRTSVDHGTAFSIAGRGVADAAPLRAAIEAAVELVAGRLPRRAARPAG